MAEDLNNRLAEPVELAEGTMEPLGEMVISSVLVEVAERREAQAQLEPVEAVQVVLVLMVVRTQVEMVGTILEVEEVPVSMVELEEVETMMAELVEVVAQVSELSEQLAQARLRGTASMVTVVLPVMEGRLVLAAARVAMETPDAS